MQALPVAKPDGEGLINQARLSPYLNPGRGPRYPTAALLLSISGRS